MPWDRSQPTAPKYRSTKHRNERARHLAILKRAGSVECAQPECVMPSRTIYHGEPTHLGHDDSGQHVIGLVHPLCNVRDGAKRGNRRSRGLDTQSTCAWSI
jgi:hypothetical protein